MSEDACRKYMNIKTIKNSYQNLLDNISFLEMTQKHNHTKPLSTNVFQNKPRTTSAMSSHSEATAQSIPWQAPSDEPLPPENLTQRHGKDADFKMLKWSSMNIVILHLTVAWISSSMIERQANSTVPPHWLSLTHMLGNQFGWEQRVSVSRKGRALRPCPALSWLRLSCQHSTLSGASSESPKISEPHAEKGETQHRLAICPVGDVMTSSLH